MYMCTYRVLSTHQPEEEEEGGEQPAIDGVIAGSSSSERDVTGTRKLPDVPQMLSQQELDSTFISTEDFLVSWLIR